MSVIQLLTEFIKYKNLTILAFCRSIGVSETCVGSMRNNLHPNKLHKIMTKYPELSSAWLATGEGQMIRQEYNPMLSSIERYKLVGYTSEAFKDKLIEMFQKGEIYSPSIVKDKDYYIERLIAKVTHMEDELERLKKEHGIE